MQEPLRESLNVEGVISIHITRRRHQRRLRGNTLHREWCWKGAMYLDVHEVHACYSEVVSSRLCKRNAGARLIRFQLTGETDLTLIETTAFA